LDDWIAIVIIGIAVVLLIGNFSTFQKSSKQKLRKTSLNDLKETLPRTHKQEHRPSFPSKGILNENNNKGSGKESE
jgi:type II secretory pathway pseudopilin PulG